MKAGLYYCYKSDLRKKASEPGCQHMVQLFMQIVAAKRNKSTLSETDVMEELGYCGVLGSTLLRE